jgi:hypothetical protein
LWSAATIFVTILFYRSQKVTLVFQSVVLL